MTILDALDKLKVLHDEIKEHPYWMTFDYGMFKKEICPKYIEILSLYSYLRHNKDYEGRDTPFFALISTIYHDFSTMLRVLTYSSKRNGIEMKDTDDFKLFYLPVLQNFLQLVHFFINGMNNEETMIMYMPKNVYEPKQPMVKYVAVYHESWTMNDGYKPWFGEFKWIAICEVKRERKQKLIEKFQKIADEYKKKNKQTLAECYEHHVKDLEAETNLIFKLV